LEIGRRQALLLGALGIAAAPCGTAMARTNGMRDAVIVNALGQLSNPNSGDEATADERRQRVEPRVIADARASGLTAVNITLGNSGISVPSKRRSVRSPRWIGR
jgi:membrane dipeptidase